MINLIFFGSPKNSKDLLEILDKDNRFNILAVVTQPDRPAGRGRKKRLPTPVAQYAQSNNIITLKPKRHPDKKHLLKNPKKLKKLIEKLNPDLLFVYEFGQLIPKQALDIPRLGGLNIHFSLLPSYRGPAPLPWQIVNNEKYTGISVVKMTPEFDKGKIIYQKKVPIRPTDTTPSLHSRLSRLTLELIPNLLSDYTSGKLSSTRPTQPTQPKSYFPRLKRSDGFIPWKDFLHATSGTSAPLARQIERKLRAFSPWPGVWTTIPAQASQAQKHHFPCQPEPETSDGDNFFETSLLGRGLTRPLNKVRIPGALNLQGHNNRCLTTKKNSSPRRFQREKAGLDDEKKFVPEEISRGASKRLKILEAKLANNRLLPLTVQLSGKPPQPWQSLLQTLKPNP